MRPDVWAAIERLRHQLFDRPPILRNLLRVPKKSLVIENLETGEELTRGGVWLRLPMDGEPLRAKYKNQIGEK